jgi:uncharacterized damage-inducible protein DinB
MTRLELAVEQIVFARTYTIELLESVPDPDPAKYPSPADLRAVFDRVHEQVLREVRGLDEGELDQPVPHPHPFATTKLQALLWCARHEMLHAGQIGLLRRQLGYPPLQ